MNDSVEQKVKELEDKGTELDRLQNLKREFPDLKISIDRWRRERYSSASVNGRATDVDFRHNCGCCDDSPLEARPYLKTMGVQVFADPDRYCVADRYDGIYDMAYSDWEEPMRKKGISDAAIEKVRRYLAAVAPPDSDYDDDEDDY